MTILAIGDLSLFAAALICLIILVALWVLRDLLRGTLGRIKYIGPWIVAGFDAAISLARRLMDASLNAAMHGLTWVIHVIIHAAEGLIDEIRKVLWDISNAVWRLQHTWIPRIERDLRNAAHTLFRTAEADIAATLKTAEKDISKLGNAIKGDFNNFGKWVKGLLAAAVAGVLAELARAVARLLAQINSGTAAARAYAHTLFTQAEADIAAARQAATAATRQAVTLLQSQIRTAEQNAGSYASQQATTARRQAEHTLNTQARSSMSTIWEGELAQLHDLRQALGSGFPAVTALLAAVPTQAPASVAQAVAADASMLPPITRLMTDCVIPNCENLGGFGRELTALKDILFGAAFAAFIVAMITDPQPTAKVTYDALDVPLQETINAIKTFAKVR